jgi:hypothetical protein
MLGHFLRAIFEGLCSLLDAQSGSTTYAYGVALVCYLEASNKHGPLEWQWKTFEESRIFFLPHRLAF